MKYKLGILGAGKMGSAVLFGIIKSKAVGKKEVLLYLHGDNSVKKFGEELKYDYTRDLSSFFSSCEVVLLAGKPQTFGEIVAVSDGLNFDGKCIISIAAGITAAYLKSHFKGADIIRCMPNTPALINMGVTTVSSFASEKYTEFAKKIFSSVGKVYEIDESLMDDTVALNGSMPAYLYTFANSFIKSAEKSGVPYETAKGLVAESIISSANMILKSDDDIDTLIKNVCSKGGTTVAGLEKLEEGKFSENIDECVRACAKRSRELAK